jgi:hypothetical protein
VGVISGVNCQFRKKTSLENRCVSSTEDWVPWIKYIFQIL